MLSLIWSDYLNNSDPRSHKKLAFGYPLKRCSTVSQASLHIWQKDGPSKPLLMSLSHVRVFLLVKSQRNWPLLLVPDLCHIFSFFLVSKSC
jgi:hypothetical protein